MDRSAPAPAPARDDRGRLLPGHTANPHGRPPGRASKPYLRLLEAAEAVGAQVVVMVPPRVAPPPVADPGPLPPRAA